MPVSKFGERQYELAANLELIGSSGAFFVPTTSLEGALGIDVAMAPGDKRIWELLGIRPRAGTVAGPGVFSGWPQGGPGKELTPPFLTSLFLQYKRSSYLTRAHASEWATHGKPYWRVNLSRHQHLLLRDLEAAVQGRAVVRYAAPKFWRHEDMWTFQATGGILDNSMLVSPVTISPEHSVLTFSDPAGLVGHSSPERLPVESTRDLARVVVEHVSAETTLDRRRPRAYLDDLAVAVAEWNLSRRGRRELQDEVWSRLHALRGEPVEDSEVATLADVALIAEAANAARASWVIIAVRPNPPDPEASASL
jgi:hypothetical protein